MKLIAKLIILIRPLDYFFSAFVSSYLEVKNHAQVGSDSQKRMLEERAKNELKKISSGQSVKVYPRPKK